MPRVKRPKRTRLRHFIKEWRDHRGLSQEQVASRLQISRENYGRIEAGKVPYNQDFLELAAWALNCDVADLLMRDPTDKSAPWSILDTLKKADTPTRERILEVAVVMTKKTGT